MTVKKLLLVFLFSLCVIGWRSESVMQLIGTSFSRNSNFLGFLQLALGAQVGSFAKDGGEFSGSANEYFSNPAFTQTPPKLLIWEIPERDLQTPYEPIKWSKAK